jgi:hypothetical protein
VEECAVFLFLQFVDIQEVSLRDVNALKKQFGKGDLSLAKKIQKVVVANSHKTPWIYLKKFILTGCQGSDCQ